MSGPEKDLFGEPNQAACSVCHAIHKTTAKARECAEEHVRQERRERARRFARTGISQVKKPEATK